MKNAWTEYRGWAARARALQAASRNWTSAATACAAIAAVTGAGAGMSEIGTDAGRGMAFVAAACTAVAAVLGKDILATGREAGWIRARATAEAIKSECYRFAAKAGDYINENREDLFAERRDHAIDIATKAGLSRASVDETDDPKCPQEGMTPEWYRENRIKDQRDFFNKKQAENESELRRLRWLALLAAIAGVLLGLFSGYLNLPNIAPWVGVTTTVATLIAANGLMERRQYLTATYAATRDALGRLEERFERGRLDFPGLVAAAEDVLAGESSGWTERMTKTITAPPSVPQVGGGGGAGGAGAPAAPAAGGAKTE